VAPMSFVHKTPRERGEMEQFLFGTLRARVTNLVLRSLAYTIDAIICSFYSYVSQKSLVFVCMMCCLSL